MANILVTGGAGYIGSHTVRDLLSEDHNVVVLDNLVYGHTEFVPENVKFVHADLADKEKLTEIFDTMNIDAVIHFAAFAYVGESVRDPAKYFNNNLCNGLNLLGAMLAHNVHKIVFSSSCATYGIPPGIPITEDMPQNPINPYGLTKLTFERILDYYDAAYGLKFVSLRYFNAAGAMPDASIGEWHDPETHVIPLMLRSLCTPLSSFQVFGDDYPTSDGSCIRDYIHVCDLARGHILALNHLIDGNPSAKMNLGTGKGVSVFELINIVEDVTGMRMNYAIAPRREGDPAELVADPARAERLFGWRARFDIRAIVEHAWSWQKKMMMHE